MLATIKALVQVGHSIAVRIFPGKSSGPGWRAKGVGCESMLKAHTFVGNAVEGRRLNVLISVTAQCLFGMIIGKDEQDIGLLCLSGEIA